MATNTCGEPRVRAARRALAADMGIPISELMPVVKGSDPRARGAEWCRLGRHRVATGCRLGRHRVLTRSRPSSEFVRLIRVAQRAFDHARIFLQGRVLVGIGKPEPPRLRARRGEDEKIA
jgi:hypothetical protein